MIINCYCVVFVGMDKKMVLNFLQRNEMEDDEEKDILSLYSYN